MRARNHVLTDTVNRSTKRHTGRRNISENGPDPVDVHVGAQVRKARAEIGMTQEKLAELCHITFQQIQKYERGTNRISCSRLVQIAGALGRSVVYFFPDQDHGILVVPLERAEARIKVLEAVLDQIGKSANNTLKAGRKRKIAWSLV